MRRPGKHCSPVRISRQDDIIFLYAKEKDGSIRTDPAPEMF